MKPGLFVAAFIGAWACCGVASAEEAPLVCTRTDSVWTRVSGPEGADCSILKDKDLGAPIAKICGRKGDCSAEAYFSHAPNRLKVRKGAGGASQTTEKGGVEDLRAQFFYQITGRFSQNIAPPEDFTIYNAIIGEGHLEEPSDDLLISVFMSKLDDDIIRSCDQRLTVVITDDKNNTLVVREFDISTMEIPHYKKIVGTEIKRPAPVNGKHLLKTARAVLFSNFPTGRVKIEAMFGDELLAIWLFFGDGE